MLPAGVIVLWSKAIGSIPTGWVLCDGNNGTPNLNGRFVVGAGDTYAVDATGGEDDHEHEFTSEPHTHEIPGGTGLDQGFARSATTGPATSVGFTNAGTFLPPFHALAYIMKT